MNDGENVSVAGLVEDEDRSYLPLLSSVVLKLHRVLQDQGDNSRRIFQNLLFTLNNTTSQNLESSANEEISRLSSCSNVRERENDGATRSDSNE